MKCVLVVAVSQDGYITKGHDPNPASWTSPEDQKFFQNIKSQHKLFIMGSKTFDAAKITPTKGTLRVVLTNNPEKYQELAVKDQLEFHSLSPRAFVEKYKNYFDACLVLGGSRVYSDFLEAGLVDEAFITIEPFTHHVGTLFLPNNKSMSSYGFVEVDREHLNSRGTELIHFMKSSQL